MKKEQSVHKKEFLEILNDYYNSSSRNLRYKVEEIPQNIKKENMREKRNQ